MPEQQPDDLVTALAEVIQATQNGLDYSLPDAEWHAAIARAVLARTDLVVPASAVLDLAAKWDAQYATGSRGAMFGDLYAAELRALVAGETP